MPTLIAPPDRLAAGDHRLCRGHRCSRMPARRANMPGCWRSAPITNRAARAQRDVCLIPSSARTAPIRPVRRWRGCAWWWSAATATATSIWPTCAPRRRSMRDRLAALMVTYPSHARRVRGGDPRHLRRGARGRRPGLHGRRQYERAGGADLAGGDRRRCVPPEPAQDVLHSAWRRRAGRRADRRRGASGAVPAEPSAARGCRAGERASGRFRRRRSAAR